MSGITQGVKDFIKGSHQADSTEVCTETAPEIVQETVRPQEHVQTAEAIDRERHVHHHQHRIQPIEHKQTLDAKHVHVTAPAVTREHKEDMLPEHQETLEKQRNLHLPSTTTGDVERSNVSVGTHVNEHQHHHIHETVQPVIQRETVQPTVVHHTAGIHEKVHDAPIVHEVTHLPTISHETFLKNKGQENVGTHSDKGHTHQYFEGAPKIGAHGHSHAGPEGTTGTGSTTGSGLTGSRSGVTGSEGVTGGKHSTGTTTGSTTGTGAGRETVA
ncbi:hypothetical protein IAT38_005914 [Cryptococcus sp. DSM 104549]